MTLCERVRQRAESFPGTIVRAAERETLLRYILELTEGKIDLLYVPADVPIHQGYIDSLRGNPDVCGPLTVANAGGIFFHRAMYEYSEDGKFFNPIGTVAMAGIVMHLVGE